MNRPTSAPDQAAQNRLDTLYNIAAEIRNLVDEGIVLVQPQANYIALDARAASELLDVLDAAIGMKRKD
jgi:hypothetical protein